MDPSDKMSVLQNTILNELWDDSYSKDMAILDTLLMQDRLEAEGQEDNPISTDILCTLQNEFAQQEDREGFGEILDVIEKFMDRVKLKAQENFTDHTEVIKCFKLNKAREDGLNDEAAF